MVVEDVAPVSKALVRSEDHRCAVCSTGLVQSTPRAPISPQLGLLCGAQGEPSCRLHRSIPQKSGSSEMFLSPGKHACPLALFQTSQQTTVGALPSQSSTAPGPFEVRMLCSRSVGVGALVLDTQIAPISVPVLPTNVLLRMCALPPNPTRIAPILVASLPTNRHLSTRRCPPVSPEKLIAPTTPPNPATLVLSMKSQSSNTTSFATILATPASFTLRFVTLSRNTHRTK